ncbi:IclR family mhp operon transcriptional activator [Mesorhizobium soli]|uniref:DNA-binding transcriptional regulator n=1 Tax=Pseudaminobacter soli (ex Li et al. 2025) TaxID=1295366 RepID=UPI002476C992|nr:DNA-binding transcriptional regulator [Mesorhizobium soli]MDH6232212.1 IclR family mhp operon transcriptional activator [Mesorhizobium soli]
MAFAPVQAVTKALEILAALNRNGLASVGELHGTTGIPKPTIVRLLQTLVAAGYVSRDEKTRGYHVTAAVGQLSSGFHGSPMVIEVARPFADKLTKQILWPCAVCTLDLDAVVINYSTIPDSPISPFHASLGRRLSIGGRALGRAYICFCPEDEQRVLRNVMRASQDPENNRIDDETFASILARTRADGFAKRDAHLEPRSSGTIAMPIRMGNRVLATFGVTYFKSALKEVRSQKAIIDAMRLTIAQIEERLEEQPLQPRGCS